MNKKIRFIFILILLAVNLFVYNYAFSDNLHKLVVFYSPACHKCNQIKNEVMPYIEKKYKDRLKVEYLDISDVQNYKLLLGLQKKYGVKLKNVVPVFYLEGNFLIPDGLSKKEFIHFITEALNKTQEGLPLPLIDLIEHFRGFRPFTIISAGLIDGINPCAFTVIVFFISFLALQGYKKRELIIIGLSFIAAVFLTYLFIGLGLFSFLYRLRGFWFFVKIFNFSVGIFSFLLGLLCLYDLFKFKKTAETEGLILQLPPAVKNQIHKVIGLHYRIDKSEQSQGQNRRRRIFKLMLSALITGFVVSILEAVCTGQVYLPTIAFVLKTTHLKLEALGYLLLYNIMFIVPLLIIFLFALLGVTSQQFANFLKKHLLTVKLFMAILFFSLGVFLLCRP